MTQPTLSGLCCSYAYETIGAMYVHPGSMILTGDLEALRSFMAHSLVGATIDDEAMRSGVASLFGQTGVYGWRSEEGHCNVDLSTWLLVPRGVASLLEEDTDTNRRALRAWLPPPKDLLRMAKYESLSTVISFDASQESPHTAGS